MENIMKYSHPTEIPMSKWLFFDWISDRIPCASVNVRGDSYPITWAADNELYVGTGDPNWAVKDGSNYASNPSKGGWAESEELYKAMCGMSFEKLIGAPESFRVERVNDMPGFIGPGGSGAKPTGVISVGGKLYLAVQNLLGPKPPRHRENSQHGSDVAIICSDDFGKTWTPDLSDMLLDFEKEHYQRVGGYGHFRTTSEERTEYKGWRPMFPGCLFGGPSFIQYGKDNADAVDDYVYAVSSDQWDNGDEIRLGRVKNDSIQDKDCWEFAIVDENYNVRWVKSLEDAQPILEISAHLGAPEVVYIKSLQKYILLTWALHTDFRTPTGSELTILESDQPWGPFSLVHYEWMWYNRSCSPYTPKIPLKWFNQQELEGYVLHSGNWETQIPYYIPQVKKFRFTVRTDDCR
jgi:hypothetical protein